MKFSEEQWKAVVHDRGPMMVVAGPGAGKTMVITHRLQYLIERYGIKPERILVITFTRAAATEMRERFLRLCPEAEAKMEFGTFHSVFYGMLRQLNRCHGKTVLEEKEKLELLKPFFSLFAEGEEEIEEKTVSFLSEFDRYRNEGRDLVGIPTFSCCERDVFLRAAKMYQEEKLRRGKIDFEDMQMMLLETIHADAKALEWLQKKYDYFLVDEFQDINRIQFKILHALCQRTGNLFVVGDEDQAIYGFRGSDPEFLLKFGHYFPGAKTVYLLNNYRCSGRIVALSQQLIRHNQQRFDKKLSAIREQGNKVRYQHYHSPKEEAVEIRNTLRFFHKKGIPYHEMAVLFRTHQQSREIVRALLDNQIPFRYEESVGNIFDHWITRDFLAHLEFIQCPQDENLFQKVTEIGGIPDFIKEEAVEMGGNLLQNIWKIPEISLSRRTALEEWGWHMKRMASMPIQKALVYWWYSMGYRKYAARYAEENKLPFERLEAVVDELWQRAKEWNTLEAWKKDQEKICHNLREKSTEGVRLCTMHGAKGLEFSLVWCASVNKEILPHHLAEDREEERRIFYVAVTRAKDYLFLSDWGLKRENLSIFIKESINLEESVNNGFFKSFFQGKTLRKRRKMIE